MCCQRVGDSFTGCWLTSYWKSIFAKLFITVFFLVYHTSLLFCNWSYSFKSMIWPSKISVYGSSTEFNLMHTHTHTTPPLVEELVKWTKHFRIVSVASGESGLLCKGMQSILWPSFLFLLQKENNLDMIAEVAFYDETSSIHSTRYAVSLIL